MKDFQSKTYGTFMLTSLPIRHGWEGIEKSCFISNVRKSARVTDSASEANLIIKLFCN
jgi:hypothetical protein